MEEHLADCFGLNDSKYQWAVDEYYMQQKQARGVCVGGGRVPPLASTRKARSLDPLGSLTRVAGRNGKCGGKGAAPSSV